MNETPDERMSSAESAARDAVRALPSVQADPAFRARLSESFATGAFPAPARRIVPLPWYRRGAVAWIAVPAAAAAALAIVLTLNQGPQWDLVATAGDGIVIVDDRPIPMNHVEDLRRALKSGARVLIPDGGEVQMTSASNVILLATAGTEFVVPGSPGRWFARTMRADMAHGTLRVTTQPGFAGARLLVTTPEAVVEVSGSTLAIICESAGTCVCVLEGDVRVGRAGGEMAQVAGGMRRFVFGDERAPVLDEMRPMERTKLTMFREQALSPI